MEKLPVTFRVNPGLTNFEALLNMFQDPDFIGSMAIQQDEKDQTEAVGTK